MNRFHFALFRAAAVLLVATMTLVACGGGGGHSVTPLTPASAQPIVAPGSSFTTQQSGSIALPSGVSMPMAALTVANSLGSATPATGGTFTATAYQSGPQLTFVRDQNGNTVLAGFLGTGATTIDSLSTAKVLAYFGAGFYALPSPYRTQMIDAVATVPGFSAVQNAVVAALQANPSGLASNAGVAAALSTFVSALYAPNSTLSLSHRLRSVQASRSLRDVLINPSNAQSGITTINDFPNGVHFMNNYRRAAEAFIDQDSIVDQSGTRVSMPVTDVVPPQDISAVSGLSTVTSTLADAVRNYVSGNPTAYSPVSTSSVALSNIENAKSTRFIITIVGAGAPNSSLSLRAEEASAQRLLVVQQLLQDFIVPIIASIIIPANSSTIDDSLNFIGGSGTLADLATVLSTSAPQIYTLMNAGEVGDAVTLAFNTIANSNTVQLAFMQYVLSKVQSTSGVAAAETFFNGANGLMNKSLAIFSGALVAADVATVVANIAASNDADQVTVDVAADTVTLTPATVSLVNGATQDFTVNVPSASDSEAAIVWHWSNTGTAGHITDHINGHLDNFDSSSNDVTYIANLNGTGNDTVTVTAFEVQQQNRVQIGNPQSATVTVAATPTPSPLGAPPAEPQSRCAAMTVSPHVVSVGGTITATAGPAQPGSCGGGPGSVIWTWGFSAGATPVSGSCQANSATCTLTAVFVTSGYVSLCINGASVQGPWDSCDYYAVVPQ